MTIPQFFAFLFLVMVVLGFELRASHLLGKPLESLCQPFFVLDIFEIGSCEVFAQG
jgi:hypothetical protein